jgi:anti-anti-sigma factor
MFRISRFEARPATGCAIGSRLYCSNAVEEPAVSIALSQTDGASLIRLEGGIDISSAADLKTALLDAVKAGKGVVVKLVAVSEFDLTAYQLLWAAQREAKKAGLKFAVAGQLPKPIQASLAAMGLDAGALYEQVA